MRTSPEGFPKSQGGDNVLATKRTLGDVNICPQAVTVAVVGHGLHVYQPLATWGTNAAVPTGRERLLGRRFQTHHTIGDLVHPQRPVQKRVGYNVEVSRFDHVEGGPVLVEFDVAVGYSVKGVLLSDPARELTVIRAVVAVRVIVTRVRTV